MTTVIFLQNLEEYSQNNINRDLQASGYKIEKENLSIAILDI